MKRHFLFILVILLNLACLLPIPFLAPAAPTATTAWVPVATLEITNTPFAPGQASPTSAATLLATSSPSVTATQPPVVTEPTRPTNTATPAATATRTPTPTSTTPATSQPTRTATSTSSPVIPSATPSGGGGGSCLVTNEGYASAVVTLINNERANNGLPALT